ncbi:LOW QUALITY PROTEIN: integrator complex assembly factor BRAT1 [Sphaeramia orbicularis]|uniref:LOW QUALITY PROTEIN: integrator complex assembly factor BRAT1 n=1 Tax=Sphaeramia orbicularis TaxID=375764 RepID=UPI001180D719|nr:LOW QUALITY PROTEIN: BRCA1-associated ATM activator 1 [Sphaeramia orbicularis]
MHTEGTLTHTTVSTMDTECVSLLPRVCEVLADSGRSLPDDTSLEKLLDWFTGLNKAGGSLLTTCPCLLEFISTVISNSTSDPAVLSFTIKLTGLMAATEDGFRTLQECSALDLVFNLQPWHEAGLWDDPCIRIGWIQGIRSMLMHPKALCFFVQSGFIDPLLQLQTDPSLFVASAANQLLAHILVFFQPNSFPTRNDNDKQAADGERAHTCFKASTAIDTEHLVLDMENSSEYTAVIMMISQYLKESLVPKEKAQIHQSVQTLKLLVLLLNQARPPLRDDLLHSVLDSLEALVKSGHSQLTLPLMDAVLAANSTDEQGVTHLLSSMLEMNKPSELIQAAAAFLRRGPRDSTHTPKAVRTLLLPLDIITGHCLAGADAAADQSWSQMQEQLRGKTSCISIICICLTNTAQITLMPPDVLPCHPGLIISEVVSLLRICSGDSSSSSSIGCTEALRNIVGSGKVQKCALEALAVLSNCSGAKDKVNEVFTVLINYLDNPNSDPTVLHKSYHALVKWTSMWTDVMTEQLRRDLIKVVKKRVCDMRWEVRDSTVEFVGQLAYSSDALLDGCCTTPLLREVLQDQESYVRASAVSALAQTLTRSWQQGAAPTQEQTDIVNRLLGILSEDSEGFARRAVVKFFISWFSSCASHSPPSSSSSSSSLLMKSVCSVLSLGSADLDWEVKVHTLELAELLMDAVLSGQRGYRKDRNTDPAPSHPYAVASARTHSLHHTSGQTGGEESGLVGTLESLVEVGVVSVLLSGLVDCDRPVGLKACRLLLTLRDTVCCLDGTAAMATASTVTCELPCQGWGQEITKTLGQTTRRGLNGADEAESVECDDVSAGVGGVCVSVCDLLRSLGLDDRLTVLSRSSDHVHNSPLSLLQDILTASAAHTHTDSQTGEEVIVDCY